MYIQLAPFRLKAGVDEKTLIEASDNFEKDFVQKQKGIIKRMLLKNIDGSYADLVFFESKEDADRVLEAEHAIPEFFTLMQNPDMGVLSFHQIKTYEKQV
jgi:chlorite dismutase